MAPDGLICTAQFPAPVGSATVETIWSVSNAVMAALNKLLATSPKYRYRAQCISDGCMATFNLGGINQYGEPFGLHLMDPLAAAPVPSPPRTASRPAARSPRRCPCIADVERNEQAIAFYLHPPPGRRIRRRRQAPRRPDRRSRARRSAASRRPMALVMTHRAESPNTAGLAGGWPGSTVVQSMGWGAIDGGLPNDSGKWERFGPKPGLMPMTNRDVFSVIWQGGGGWGDPLEREAEAVARDVISGAVSAETAREIYGVVGQRRHRR